MTRTEIKTAEPLVVVVHGSPIAKFVRSYQFDASDEGYVYTPSSDEQCMIEDAICSFISDSELLTAALGVGSVPDLVAALQKIIDMNVQYAIDRYGDASKAEDMSCVRVARAALHPTQQPPHAGETR